MCARASRSALVRGHLRKTSLVLVLGLAAIAACEGADSYVYTARRYDAAGACLEPYAPVEVVDGPGVAATCPETCLTVGEEVFVTNMCPPLPAIATELQADAEACVAARGVSGSTCGEEPEADASADPDAGSTGDGSTGDASASAPDLDATTPDAGDGA